MDSRRSGSNAAARIRLPGAHRRRDEGLPLAQVDLSAARREADVLCDPGRHRDLRILADRPNPCAGVEPPGDRDTRKARRKPFVYPKECAALLACADVPLEWREIYAIAAYTYLRPGELRVLTFGDLDLEAASISVTKAWDYAEEKVKAPKTRNGVRRVPVEQTLAPLLTRMREGKKATDLVVPLLSRCDAMTIDGRRVTVDRLAMLFRQHLTLAGVERTELHQTTATHVQANFRSWRDSGLTWLAMTALGVDKIMRRAGHDMVQTTMGYVKQAEDLTGDLGTPFAPLPDDLVKGVTPTVERGGFGPGFGPKPTHLRETLEREKGFEPSTSTLARWHSTTELLPRTP